MSDRIANLIILCEDSEQQNLLMRYLRRASPADQKIRFLSLPAGRGAGSAYVLANYAREVKAHRLRAASSSSRLAVMLDADRYTVADRLAMLSAQLSASGMEPIVGTSVLHFIPKWQLETWVKCLLGENWDEDGKTSDIPIVSANQIEAAAEKLYQWTRPNALAGPTCVDSLEISLANWQILGS